MTHARRQLGIAGEAAVAQWYRQRGWMVVASNWRCRDGEIDLVVTKGRLLAFCEVKSRSSATFGVPAEAVTLAKQRKLRQLAAIYLREHGSGARQLRFDVASVLAGDVTVIENAF